jgi:sugar phosphate isomerase/epimerase
LRIGCCTGLDNIAAVEKAGYDYIELPVGTVLPERPESEFESVLKQLEGCAIRPEAWNCLIPGDLKLTGPNVDFYRIERYLRTALDRVAKLGGKVVVFGSGGARSIPEGYVDTDGRRQLLEFISLCGNIAASRSLTLAIEPLNHKESNVINSVTEAVEFAEMAARPEVKALADLYHIDEESEPLSDVAEAGSYLAHCHTADTGRYAPGSGAYDHVGFFRAMKDAGYDDRISIECRWNDFHSELVPALRFLRCIANQVAEE